MQVANIFGDYMVTRTMYIVFAFVCHAASFAFNEFSETFIIFVFSVSSLKSNMYGFPLLSTPTLSHPVSGEYFHGIYVPYSDIKSILYLNQYI